MKDYIVTVNFSHESYGGYDHNDGDEEFHVRARNEKSAKTKALIAAYDRGGGYHREVKSVRLENLEPVKFIKKKQSKQTQNKNIAEVFGSRLHMLETLHLTYRFILDQDLAVGLNSLNNTDSRLTTNDQRELGKRLAKYWELKQ